MTNEKKGLKTSPFDPAEYIGGHEAMQDYLNVTLEEDGDDLKKSHAMRVKKCSLPPHKIFVKY